MVAARPPLHGVGLVGHLLEPEPLELQEHVQGPYTPAQMQRYVDQALQTGTADVTDAWTDLTWLLYNKHVPWAYYVQTATSRTARTTAPRPAHR